MNKNELLQMKKTESVKAAIKELKHRGVSPEKVNNKQIIEVILELFGGDKDKTISYNKLSKKYYREGIPKWIKDIYEIAPHNKALQMAKERREKNYAKKLKRIEKYGNELIEKIGSGQVVCENFTRKFLRDWIYYDKKEELAASIFSSTPEYKQIFDNLLASYHKGNINLSSPNNSIKESGKLKTELKLTQRKLNDIVSNIFVSVNSDEGLFTEGDNNEFKGIILNKSSLIKYILFMEDKMEAKVDAYKLFRYIVDNCSLTK